MANVAKDFAQLISQSKSNKTGPYDTQATVKRVEGNTVWVSIPGGVDETPIDKTVNCSAGDKVQVRVSGGRAWITGNASAPPTDDTTAIKARTTANEAQVIAVDAKETADAVEGVANSAYGQATQALQIAGDTNQYFWFQSTGADTGAHITEVPQDKWNDVSDPDYHSGGNLLARSNGIAVRDGLTELATFGASGVQIGQANTGQCIVIEPTAVAFKDSGLIYAEISYNTGTVIKDILTNHQLKIGALGFTLFDYQGAGLTVNGNSVSATGDITANNHSSPIGTTKFAHLTSSKNIATGASTGTRVCSVSLEAGTWVVVGNVRFSSNSSGYRFANLSTTDASSAQNISASPTPSTTTSLSFTKILAPTATTTYYLNAGQTSGSQLSLPVGGSDGSINGIMAVRIA